MTAPSSTSRSGCTTCGTEQTATVDGHNGRRCAQHPPRFDPTRAVHLALHDPAQAMSYCRTTFPEATA